MLPLTSGGSQKQNTELYILLGKTLFLLLLEQETPSNLKAQHSADSHCFFSSVSAFTL